MRNGRQSSDISYIWNIYTKSFSSNYITGHTISKISVLRTRIISIKNWYIEILGKLYFSMLQQPVAAEGVDTVYEYSLDYTYIYIYIHFLHNRPYISPWIKSICNFSRDRVTIVWSLWRHQQSIVTSSAKRKPSKWDTEAMCEDHRFYRRLWIRYVV